MPRDNEGMLGAHGITGCGCWTCVEAIVSKRPWPDNLMFPFIVCDTCGNKRCPHAEQHDLICTGSNEPGQPGATRYRILTDEEQEAARRAFWEEDDD